MYRLPVVLLLFVLYILALVAFFFLIKFLGIALAFRAIGISADAVLLVLLATIFGSMINIPLTRVKSDQPAPKKRVVSHMGWKFRVPEWQFPRQTIIAVNVGGAVIPCLLSLYVLFHIPSLWIEALLATTILSLVVYAMSEPKKGAGIVVPLFVPPVAAALIALLLNPEFAPSIAYVSGTLGTLIGADLLNIHHIKNLGAPIASIGGAGTFDGIFLTGIFAVLIAMIF